MRRILLAVFALLAAQGAEASYLYWMVDTSSSAEGEALAAALDAAASLTTDDLAGARLVQRDGEGTLSTVDAVGASAFNTARTAEVPTIDLATLGKYYSYYIEYVATSARSHAVVATSRELTYAELVSQQAVYVGSELSVPSLSPWTGSFSSVPEPQSGLLVCLGLALLALKRRAHTLHKCDAIIEETECGKNAVYTLKNA